MKIENDKYIEREYFARLFYYFFARLGLGRFSDFFSPVFVAVGPWLLDSVRFCFHLHLIYLSIIITI
jgi:hypothetical protein